MLGKIKPQYSGPRSQKIWNTINSLGNRSSECYSLMVALQNHEEFVLRVLNEAIQQDKNSKNIKSESPEHFPTQVTITKGKTHD